MIELKNSAEINKMDAANRIVHAVLNRLASELKPGIVLEELDRLAESMTIKMGGKPAFKGYNGYPASVCISVNDEVVHGIPLKQKVKEGDIVSLDYGVVLDGFYGDAAKTCPVGSVDSDAVKLMDVTRESLAKAIEKAKVGNRVSDLGNAVQSYVESFGFSVVRDYVGHGIGRTLHEEPQIPNFGQPGNGPRLRAGMVIAIEPMVNEGGAEVTVDPDGWTVRTKDHRRSAHFEYSLVVTKENPRILGVERE